MTCFNSTIKAHASQGTDGVFETTFHELAHASHFRKVGNGYWIKYINYIITYGAYGNGRGKNAGYAGVGEMWGNYFSALCMDAEIPRIGGVGFYLNENRDWFNPGFMEDVDNILDITTSEIFSCLTSGTNTFNRLITQLKTKTINDEQVDDAFASYPDWP